MTARRTNPGKAAAATMNRESLKLPLTLRLRSRKLHVRDVIYISSSARQYIGETGDRSPSSAAQKSAQLGIRLTYGDVRR